MVTPTEPDLDAGSHPAEIDDVERSLRTELGGAQLIGEIDLHVWGPLAEEALRARAKRCDPSKLRRLWPATYATYLVYQGLVVYDHATFWPIVSIPELRDGTAAGVEFVKALQALRLPTFDDLEDQEGIGKHTRGRYIRRIHLHGGIPANAIESVLDLLRSTLRSGAASASEVMDLWSGLDLYSHLHNMAAVRCLRYTGDVAEDLVSQLLQLIRTVNRGDDPWAVGAPDHLVEGVLRFADRPATTAGWSFTPGPSVRIDPYRGEPYLRVPTGRDVVWEVNGLEVGVSSRQIEERFTIPPSSRGWDVKEFDGSDVRTRRFNAEDTSGAVLVFDERGRLHRRGSTLNGLRAFVVSTPDTVIDHVVDRRSLERQWAGYEVSTVNLRSIEELTIRPSTAVPIRIRVENQLAPRLSSGVLAGITTPDGRQVMSGRVTLAFDNYLPELNDVEIQTRLGRVRLSEVPSVDGEFDITGLLTSRGPLETDVVVRRDGCDEMSFDVTYVPDLQVRRPRLCSPSASVPVFVVAPDIDGADRWHRYDVAPGLDRVTVDALVHGQTHRLVISVNRLRWELDGPHTLIPIVGGDGFSVRLPELHAHLLLLRTGGVGVRVAILDSDVEHEEWARPDRHRPDMRTVEVRAFADTARAAVAAHHRVVVCVDGVEPIQVGVIESRYEPTWLRATQLTNDDGTRTIEVTWRELSRWPAQVLRLWGSSSDEPLLSVERQSDRCLQRISIGDLPDGRYLVELGVSSGWGSPARPPEGPNTLTVWIKSDDAGSRCQSADNVGSGEYADPGGRRKSAYARFREVVRDGDRRSTFDEDDLDELVPDLANLVIEQVDDGATRAQRVALLERIADDHWRTNQVICELHDHLYDDDPTRSMNRVERYVLDLLPMLWVHPVCERSDAVRAHDLEHLWEIAPMAAACWDQVHTLDGTLDEECDERWRHATGFSIARPRNLSRSLNKVASAIPRDLRWDHDPVELLGADAWRMSVHSLSPAQCEPTAYRGLGMHRQHAKSILWRCHNSVSPTWLGVPTRVERRLKRASAPSRWLPLLVTFGCEMLEPTAPNDREERSVTEALRAGYDASPVATRTAVIYAATCLRLRGSVGVAAGLVS